MKRKLISAVLVTVMAAGMITGCSGKNSSIKNNVKTLEKKNSKSRMHNFLPRTMSLKKNMLTVTLMHTPKQMQNDRMELIRLRIKILYFRTSAMTSSFSFWDRKEIT